MPIKLFKLEEKVSELFAISNSYQNHQLQRDTKGLDLLDDTETKPDSEEVDDIEPKTDPEDVIEPRSEIQLAIDEKITNASKKLKAIKIIEEKVSLLGI